MKPNKSGPKGASSGFNPQAYVKPGISEKDVLEIKASFDLFDEDNSGRIDPQEIKETLSTIDFSDGRFQTIFQQLADLDADGSGDIEFEEFFDLLTAKITDRDTREKIDKLFNLFDTERNGYITIQDLRRVTQDLGENLDENELETMISRADRDKDGIVDAEDFYQMYIEKFPPP